MRMRSVSKYLFGALVMCLMMMGPKVFAAEPGMGFSVTPSLTDKQIDPGLGYYYLQTKPGEAQKIEVKLSSQQEDPIKVRLYVEDAYTGTNGGMLYGVDGVGDFAQDKTLVNPISQLVKPDVEVVELQAHEEKVVSFTVTPPSENYEGAKIGQLVFQPVEDENKDGLVDKYRYAMSVILSESGDEYDDGNELALGEVKATIKRGSRLVTANLHNPLPKRLVNLEMVATITNKDTKKVVKTKKMSNFLFAPNSNVDLEMDWGLATLKAGDYTFELEAKNAYDKFNFKKDFKITSKEAATLNKESAFKIITPQWVKIVALIDGIAVLVISGLVIRQNKVWRALSKKRRQPKKNRHSKKSKTSRRGSKVDG